MSATILHLRGEVYLGAGGRGVTLAPGTALDLANRIEQGATAVSVAGHGTLPLEAGDAKRLRQCAQRILKRRPRP